MLTTRAMAQLTGAVEAGIPLPAEMGMGGPVEGLPDVGMTHAALFSPHILRTRYAGYCQIGSPG
jgi:hypothetical protein